MSVARYSALLTVAYDGTAFSGWASQRDGRSVSDVLRVAIDALDPEASGPFGASRTDAGVHASGQAAAVHATRDITPRGWVLGLNRYLPDDVSVRAAEILPLGFQPRFASRGKRYRYRIVRDLVRHPLDARTAWRLGYPLDVELMRRAAAAAVGTFDFAAFRSARDGRAITTRTLTRIDVVEASDGRGLDVVVEGSAFLHNMVRILVGTLVDVGRSRLPVDAIERALASGRREDAGETAPARGLVLEEVFLAWPDQRGARWPKT